ncbi:hypothetical protein LTR17_019797 [Elasticomyces elasticus]|nr:hypothetical protein LTR17_019797 [Elasticomyces elasticus]
MPRIRLLPPRPPQSQQPEPSSGAGDRVIGNLSLSGPDSIQRTDNGQAVEIDMNASDEKLPAANDELNDAGGFAEWQLDRPRSNDNTGELLDNDDDDSSDGEAEPGERNWKSMTPFNRGFKKPKDLEPVWDAFCESKEAGEAAVGRLPSDVNWIRALLPQLRRLEGRTVTLGLGFCRKRDDSEELGCKTLRIVDAIREFTDVLFVDLRKECRRSPKGETCNRITRYEGGMLVAATMHELQIASSIYKIKFRGAFVFSPCWNNFLGPLRAITPALADVPYHYNEPHIGRLLGNLLFDWVDGICSAGILPPTVVIADLWPKVALAAKANVKSVKAKPWYPQAKLDETMAMFRVGPEGQMLPTPKGGWKEEKPFKAREPSKKKEALPLPPPPPPTDLGGEEKPAAKEGLRKPRKKTKVTEPSEYLDQIVSFDAAPVAPIPGVGNAPALATYDAPRVAGYDVYSHPPPADSEPFVPFVFNAQSIKEKRKRRQR